MSNTATAKQIDFINGLKADREFDPAVIETATALWRAEAFDTQAASVTINALLASPRIKRIPAPSDPDLQGMHKIGDLIVKVQRAIHGSGNLYAKALVQDEEGDWFFEYRPGLIREVSNQTKLTLEQAREWGALYGTCAVCGATLTNETSIEAGIGPVCRRKF